jgi:acetaldehyde dehydrogenase
MQFITSVLKDDIFAGKKHKSGSEFSGRLRVGILGTGKIGTDLLLKVKRSAWLEPVIFAGRNLQSAGMQYAQGLGIPVSDKGINTFFASNIHCDIVFDATSAADHVAHAQCLDQLGIFAIDLTPSQIGECCVPALGMNEVLENKNISMISCGGQSSIPLAQALVKVIPNIQQLSVTSLVSPDSIGPATLANIDEYYRNTRSGLYKYTGIELIEVALLSNEAHAGKPMLNRICAYADNIDLAKLQLALNEMEQRVQTYVPGYQLQGAPKLINGGVQIELIVEGVGDYLPTYAGNLDIINCAAIAVAEQYAKVRLIERNCQKQTQDTLRTLVEEC